MGDVIAALVIEVVESNGILSQEVVRLTGEKGKTKHASVKGNQ